MQSLSDDNKSLQSCFFISHSLPTGMTCSTEKDLSNMMLNNLGDYNDMETGGRRRGKGRRPGTNLTSSRNTATPMSTQSGSLKTTSNSYR